MKRKRPAETAHRESALPFGLRFFTGAALLLPFLVISLTSDESIREVKTFAQALATGLALFSLWRFRADGHHDRHVPPRGLLITAVAAAGLLLFSTVSGLFGRTDPFTLVPLLAGAGLFLLGFHRTGEAVLEVLTPWLAGMAGLTGVLAVLQRHAGLFRLPFEAPEPRFFATALVGNPGDTAAAVVIPTLIALGIVLGRGSAPGKRMGPLVCLLGGIAVVAVTETMTALLALAAGSLVLLARSRAGRLSILGLALVMAILVPMSGAGRRALQKVAQLRAGQWDAVFTQRDIGFLAASEMVRKHPLLGTGPGTFSNEFVAARLAAEARTGRRLVHRSGSAHFENAHSEPLTVAAECGVGVALAGLAGLGWVLVALIRKEEGPKERPLVSAWTLSACLLGFGVLCVASFPLRLAVTAGPFSFLLGVAVRGISEVRFSESPRPFPRWPLAAFAVLLCLSAGLRWTAFSRFAEAEGVVRDIGSAPPAIRPIALAEARLQLLSSVGIEPRRAVTWLTLGAVHSLEGDPAKAWESYKRALALEERAEIVMNLSRLASARGDLDLAEQLSLRAVWILPRLAESAPSSVDREKLLAEITRREAEADPPSLPGL